MTSLSLLLIFVEKRSGLFNMHIRVPQNEKNNNVRQNTVDSHYLEDNGLSEILRDIQTSTYQICRIEEKKSINPNI